MQFRVHICTCTCTGILKMALTCTDIFVPRTTRRCWRMCLCRQNSACRCHSYSAVIHTWHRCNMTYTLMLLSTKHFTATCTSISLSIGTEEGWRKQSHEANKPTCTVKLATIRTCPNTCCRCPSPCHSHSDRSAFPACCTSHNKCPRLTATL